MPRKTNRLASILALLLALTPLVVRAQDVPLPDTDQGQEIKPPPPLEAVLQSLDLPYLTDDERADRRVFHGIWLDSDLSTPTRIAEAALMIESYDNPVFENPDTPPVLRAEACFRRGDLVEGLDLLKGQNSIHAQRLRAQILEGLGRFDQASKTIETLVKSIGPDQLTSAETATELARALIIRARLEGEPAAYYQDVMALLSQAHEKLDRLYWPAFLVEAKLLFEKSNAKEGTQAVIDVLRRNASCAEAWALLGQWGVKTYNYDNATKIADRLDKLARRLGGTTLETSPDADMIRARARLRQNDPDQAESFLAPTLARYPKMRDALALRCAIEAVHYDPDRIEPLLKKFDALSPGSPLALFEVGAALSLDRQYDLAETYLNRAHALQPKWPEPIIELGLLELQSGNDALALKNLETAVQLDPFHNRAANSLKLIRELVTWDTVESEHFKVRYKPGIDEILAKEMLAPLERIHDVVCGAFEYSPKRKTLIELMPDHPWFAVRITGEPHVYTFAASTGPVIGLEAPKIGKNHTNIFDWVRVVRHEFTHTVNLAMTNNRIPHWFTEAAAVHMELAPRDYNRCRLLAGALAKGELFDFEQINVAFVRPKKPTDRALAYAQGNWMYDYMIERWGKQAPLDLMAGYARGERESSLIEEDLHVTPEQFLSDFKEWAHKQVRSWGLDPDPSLEQLRFDETMNDPVLRDKAQDALAEHARDVGTSVSRGGTPQSLDLPLVPVTPELIEYWSVVHPDHPDILRLRIEQELRQNDGQPTAEMIPLLERYAKACPVDDMPHRHLARLYLASDTPEKAIPHLEYLDAREVNSDAYAIELAKRYAALHEWDRAEAKATRAVTIAPFDPSNRELAARVAIAMRDYDTAEHDLKVLIELEPNQARHKQRLEALERLRSQ